LKEDDDDDDDSTATELPKKLAPWSRLHLEKLKVAPLIKICTVFYETGRFIIIFTGAPH
jgi:hypothetical protein